jgi:hypothetical protein
MIRTTDSALANYRADVHEAVRRIEQLREAAARTQAAPAAPATPRRRILAPWTRRSARIAG